ncbi:MAG: hypothetical protein AAB221_01820 [Bacteroidota bacterium]|mgnify:FL=1
MKARILSFAAIIFSFSLIFTACQKSASTDTDYTNESSVHSDDQSRFSAEVDAVANDADAALDVTAGFSGRGEQIQICNATIVVDTISNPRTITITYNGANCFGNLTRTGVVVISMAQGVRWRNPGAIVNVNIQNLRITRLIDNKSITINGAQTYTNVSGGLLINLATLGTITHTITSSNMSVTFDNASQRTWHVAKQRVFTYNSGIVITSTGTHTEGAVTGIAEWGTNRFGRTFTTAITQPLVVRQDCNFRLTSGKVDHVTPVFNTNVTFGLDAAGNPTSCPGLGAYYMKIVWTGPGGNPHTIIWPY